MASTIFFFGVNLTFCFTAVAVVVADRSFHRVEKADGLAGL